MELNPAHKMNNNIIEYMYDFARTSKRSKNYLRSYKDIARKLEKFSKRHRVDFNTDTVNERLLEEFVDYMRSEGLMKSTIFCIVSRIKTILRKMQNDGIPVNRSCFEFSVDNELGSGVYLTSLEVNRIAALQIKKNTTRIIRDVFVIGCLTGMRYSDYIALTSANISNNTIVRRTQKTGETVVIPIHPIIRQILSNRKGEFPRYSGSQANFNATIKNICRRAGITDDIFLERTVGHKILRKKIKRYKLIASHTARRSFATNAYLAGIPTARIMLLTSHKTEEAFFRYIRITKEENARVLAGHDFFK